MQVVSLAKFPTLEKQKSSQASHSPRRRARPSAVVVMAGEKERDATTSKS